jgi:hypothetical protein
MIALIIRKALIQVGNKNTINQRFSGKKKLPYIVPTPKSPPIKKYKKGKGTIIIDRKNVTFVF